MTALAEIRDWPLVPTSSPELEHLQTLIPPWAIPPWQWAVEGGEPGAAEVLAAALPNHLRGHLCLEFFHGNLVPRDVFGRFLTSVWKHDHAELFAAYRTNIWEGWGDPADAEGWLELELEVRDRVVQMFLAGITPNLPDGLPDQLTIYRGTYGLPPEAGRQGLSWSLSRHKANWFAQRGPCMAGAINPRNEFNREHGGLVLKATIPWCDVLLWTNDRAEQEIVAAVNGPVEVQEMTHYTVTFGSVEEAMAANEDPLLIDQKLAAKA